MVLRMDQPLYSDRKDCVYPVGFLSLVALSLSFSRSPSHPLMVVKLTAVMPSDAYD